MPPAFVLAAVFAACSDDPAPPPAAMPTAGQPAAVAPAEPVSAAASGAAANTKPAATGAGAASERDARAKAATATTVADLIDAAVRGDAVAKGKAPTEIKALGDSALPALAQALAHQDVLHRRLAALTLLQWGTIPAGNAAISALAAARDDADPAVRAAADHAWRRATGDTSALEQSRAAHEEALRKAR